MQRSTEALKHQNPVTFYLRTLLYVLIALVLRALVFLPLLCLTLPAGSPWRFAALLCPIGLVFLILPYRFSFADALVQNTRSRFFSFDTALSASRYGEKLGQSLFHVVNVALWAIPMAVLLFYFYYCYQNVDMLTVLDAVMQYGGFIAAAVALCAVVFLYGVVRNSATRYIWAVASQAELPLRGELRRRLRGRRFRQLGVALVNLLLLAPFLVVVAFTLKGMLQDISTVLLNFILTQKLSLPDLSSAIGPLALAFFGLYLPLLPARRYLTAYFASKRIRHSAPKTSENAPAATLESAPSAAPEASPSEDAGQAASL